MAQRVDEVAAPLDLARAGRGAVAGAQVQRVPEREQGSEVQREHEIVGRLLARHYV